MLTDSNNSNKIP